MKSLIFIIIFLSPLIFYSCSENSTNPANGENGRVKIYMVDSPADYDEVNIVVERVEVHKAENGEEGEWIIVNNETKIYNLLELRNGASAILCDYSLSAGHYTQIRLIIGTGSNVVINGVPYELEVPSGAQTGLKLIHGFDIQTGITYELLLDFDANKSIVVTGNGRYLLKPTVRVIALALSGTISGIVLPPDILTSIWTISGSDTITTYSDITGNFKLMALHQGTYDVYITPSNPAYRDTVITNISVQTGTDTNIGTTTIFP